MPHWTAERVDAICARLSDLSVHPGRPGVPAKDDRGGPLPATGAAGPSVLVVQQSVPTPDGPLMWWWQLLPTEDGSFTVSAERGVHENPTLCVEATDEAANRIHRGSLSPGEAFLLGSMTLTGDVHAALDYLDALRSVLAAVHEVDPAQRGVDPLEGSNPE
jgi:hypothetical protein